jgi:hypothetical protein
MVKTKVRKCQICGLRPASTERGFCKNCQAQCEAEKRRKQQPTPWRYVTYKGVTVAFHQDGGDKLEPQLVRRDPDKLPKSKLINLDKYCPGFTRDQVKKLKRLCLSFAK